MSSEPAPQLFDKVATGKKLPVTNALVICVGLILGAAGIGFERGWLPNLGKKAEAPVCFGDINAAANARVSIQIGGTSSSDKLEEVAAPPQLNEPASQLSYSLRPPLDFYSPAPLAPLIAQGEPPKQAPKSANKNPTDSMATRRYYLVPEEGMAFANRRLQTGLCVFEPYLQCWMPKGFGAEIPVKPQAH